MWWISLLQAATLSSLSPRFFLENCKGAHCPSCWTMQEIKCYVCKQNGHLCCTDFSDSRAKEVTCYNCAQSGHSGLVSFNTCIILCFCVASHLS